MTFLIRRRGGNATRWTSCNGQTHRFDARAVRREETTAPGPIAPYCGRITSVGGTTRRNTTHSSSGARRSTRSVMHGSTNDHVIRNDVLLPGRPRSTGGGPVWSQPPGDGVGGDVRQAAAAAPRRPPEAGREGIRLMCPVPCPECSRRRRWVGRPRRARAETGGRCDGARPRSRPPGGGYRGCSVPDMTGWDVWPFSAWTRRERSAATVRPASAGWRRTLSGSMRYVLVRPSRVWER